MTIRPIIVRLLCHKIGQFFGQLSRMHGIVSGLWRKICGMKGAYKPGREYYCKSNQGGMGEVPPSAETPHGQPPPIPWQRPWNLCFPFCLHDICICLQPPCADSNVCFRETRQCDEPHHHFKEAPAIRRDLRASGGRSIAIKFIHADSPPAMYCSICSIAALCVEMIQFTRSPMEMIPRSSWF